MTNETDSYVFEIRSGLYRGVTHDVAEGRHIIGSGDGSDLVLMEEGLAGQHAAIVLQDDKIRIEALAGGVTVEGAGPVPAGSARTVRLPARIEIAGIETAWHLVEDATAEPVPNPQLAQLWAVMARPMVPGIAAAGVLAVALVLTVGNPIAGAAVLLDGSAKNALQRIGVSGEDQASQAARPSTKPASPSLASLALNDTVPAPVLPASLNSASKTAPVQKAKDATEIAASTLRKEVEKAGLLNVHVNASGGAVSARGFIEPSMTSRWESLQKEFDERFVGEVTLVNSVAVKAEKLPSSLGIEGVWRGAQPYIVMRGQRYLIGAIVDGGWAIRSIESDRVMLEREGRLVAMRF